MVHEENQKEALNEIKELLIASYPVARLILFGSAARGETDEESDVDVLVLTKRPLSREEHDGVTSLVFEINLTLGTNLSLLVIDEEAWEKGPISALSIHDEVEEQGILL